MNDDASMLRIDHVQLAIPPGAEEQCRRFYVDLLGMTEVSKPLALSVRGGLWLQCGVVCFHLGVEADFRPALKAHPGIAVRDLDRLAGRLAAAGHEPVWDEAVPEIRRFFISDPLGNRIEFLENRHG